MKKFYRTLSTAMIILLSMIVPMSVLAQTKEEPKKEAAKTEAPAKKKCEKQPSYKYWGITAYGSLNQFNGDLSKNILFNDIWKFGAGGAVTKQFTRVIGARFRGGWAPVAGKVDNKLVYQVNTPPAYVSDNFKSWIIEADLEATVNWVNWIMGYKPERFFSSYLVFGIGADHTQGAKFHNGNDEVIVGYLGYPSHADAADPLRYGNNSGIGKWNLEFKAVAGIGFDFNLSKHWSINPEILWRWRDGDVLDMTIGGAKQVKNDMYSGVNLGLTYKIYSGCNLKDMEKRASEIKYETTPPVLVEKGDSVEFLVKGTVPPKFFCPTAAMYFQPVLTYDGGKYEMPCGTHLYGEKLTGDGKKP